MRISPLLSSVGLAAACAAALAAQAPGLSPDLTEMVTTERAFAARALEAGWKQAFLEYFAEDAIGFDSTGVVSAMDEIRAAPDPPPGLDLVWEPRYGDIAASGDLGYLTGPAVTLRAGSGPGQGSFSAYASVWQRQADGAFKVVTDVGVATPETVNFAPGFTPAPRDDRWTGDDESGEAADTMLEANVELDAALAGGTGTAYRDRLDAAVRVHEPGSLPFVGREEAAARTAARPTWMSAITLGGEASAAGDLGYAWGSFQTGAGLGHYVRVWVRGADGRWRLALEVLQ